jgi:hypothetical protein
MRKRTWGGGVGGWVECRRESGRTCAGKAVEAVGGGATRSIQRSQDGEAQPDSVRALGRRTMGTGSTDDQGYYSEPCGARRRAAGIEATRAQCSPRLCRALPAAGVRRDYHGHHRLNPARRPHRLNDSSRGAKGTPTETSNGKTRSKILVVVVILAFVAFLAWTTVSAQRNRVSSVCRIREWPELRHGLWADEKTAGQSAQTTACGPLAAGNGRHDRLRKRGTVTRECRPL